MRHKITFLVLGKEYLTEEIEGGLSLKEPKQPHYVDEKFEGWFEDESYTKRYDFKTPIGEDLTLYGKLTSTVDYQLGKDFFFTKKDLCEAFYTDFYNFLLQHHQFDFTPYNIENEKDFIAFCTNWEANGRKELYGVGDAFAKYYITMEEDGVVENQPTTTFIGNCYHNGKYLEFIPFLERFFAYWRTDEAYTTPTNHGNDFYYFDWASLVDTAKFFFFTGDTLQDKYKWFTSERVKDALDNIPKVLRYEPIRSFVTGEQFILPNLKCDGYQFMGWFLDSDFSTPVTSISKSTKVYAKWNKN